MKEYVCNNWKIDEKIGEGKYADVYRASKKIDGVTAHCAIKHISLPKKGDNIQDLIASGAIKDKSEINEYYNELVSDIKKDFMIMKNFEGNPYFLNCYDYFQELKQDAPGVDIYIRMELAQDINDRFKKINVDEDEVLKLGLDIASALEVCEKKNIIHKDIKPDNIFYGEDGHYKLGDFGVAITSAFISKGRKIAGTYSYMSKEVYNKEEAGFATDLYSLGLVMYKLLNNGNLPFQNSGVSLSDATKMRLAGKKIPIIDNVSSEVMNIIAKACEYEASGRYKNASAFKDEIKSVISSRKKPVTKPKSEATVSVYNTDVLEKESTSLKEIEKLTNKSNDKKRSKIKKLLKIIIILLLLLLLLIFIVRGVFTECKDGYVKDGVKCVKGYYYCEDEYKLNEDDKCVKVLEAIDAQPMYSCGDGYMLNGDKCVRTDTKDAKEGYQCLDNFTLKGTKCTREEKQPAIPNASCPSGYELVQDKCAKVSYKSANVKYSCDSGYKLDGKLCKQSSYENSLLVKKQTCESSNCSLKGNSCECTTDAGRSWIYPYYSCPNGSSYSSSDRKCHYTESPKVTYSCLSGTYKNNSCYVEKTVAATINYSCSSGYSLVGNQCIKTETKTPTVKYSCADGLTLKNNACYAVITVDAVKGYTCDKGYVFTGEKCVLQESIEAEADYRCSKLYKFNEENKKCEKYKEVAPKIHYDE